MRFIRYFSSVGILAGLAFVLGSAGCGGESGGVPSGISGTLQAIELHATILTATLSDSNTTLTGIGNESLLIPNGTQHVNLVLSGAAFDGSDVNYSFSIGATQSANSPVKAFYAGYVQDKNNKIVLDQNGNTQLVYSANESSTNLTGMVLDPNTGKNFVPSAFESTNYAAPFTYPVIKDKSSQSASNFVYIPIGKVLLRRSPSTGFNAYCETFDATGLSSFAFFSFHVDPTASQVVNITGVNQQFKQLITTNDLPVTTINVSNSSIPAGAKYLRAYYWDTGGTQSTPLVSESIDVPVSSSGVGSSGNTAIVTTLVNRSNPFSYSVFAYFGDGATVTGTSGHPVEAPVGHYSGVGANESIPSSSSSYTFNGGTAVSLTDDIVATGSGATLKSPLSVTLMDGQPQTLQTTVNFLAVVPPDNQSLNLTTSGALSTSSATVAPTPKYLAKTQVTLSDGGTATYDPGSGTLTALLVNHLQAPSSSTLAVNSSAATTPVVTLGSITVNAVPVTAQATVTTTTTGLPSYVAGVRWIVTDTATNNVLYVSQLSTPSSGTAAGTVYPIATGNSLSTGDTMSLSAEAYTASGALVATTKTPTTFTISSSSLKATETVDAANSWVSGISLNNGGNQYVLQGKASQIFPALTVVAGGAGSGGIVSNVNVDPSLFSYTSSSNLSCKAASGTETVTYTGSVAQYPLDTGTVTIGLGTMTSSATFTGVPSSLVQTAAITVSNSPNIVKSVRVTLTSKATSGEIFTAVGPAGSTISVPVALTSTASEESFTVSADGFTGASASGAIVYSGTSSTNIVIGSTGSTGDTNLSSSLSLSTSMTLSQTAALSVESSSGKTALSGMFVHGSVNGVVIDLLSLAPADLTFSASSPGNNISKDSLTYVSSSSPGVLSALSTLIDTDGSSTLANDEYTVTAKFSDSVSTVSAGTGTTITVTPSTGSAIGIVEARRARKRGSK